MTATAAGQVHAIELKAGLGGCTSYPGRFYSIVFQSFQRCLPNITND